MNIFTRSTAALFATALIATGTVATTAYVTSTPVLARGAGNNGGGGGGAGGGNGLGPSDLAMYPPVIEKAVAGGPNHRPRPRRPVSRELAGCPGDVASIARNYAITHGCGTRG